jgi:outer membrane protein assembly factor BamB
MASRSAQAQLGPPPERRLSATISVRDSADSDARRYLDQVEAHIASEQWTDAVDKLRQVIEQYGDQLVALETDAAGHERFLSVRQYAHARLASLPIAARQAYRQAVDAQARQWFEEAQRTRDLSLLRRIETELFNSSWTDDALWLAGDWQLQAGEFAAARRSWSRLLPPLPEAPTSHELRFPDPSFEPVEVAARLVLVSILERDFDRARHELNEQVAGHATLTQALQETEGRLAGKSAPWGELLGQTLTEAQTWEEPRESAEWPTLGGSLTRTHRAPHPLPIAGLAWDEPVKLQAIAALPAAISEIYSRERVGELSRQPLSYFPVLVGDLLLVHHRPTLKSDGQRCRDVILAINVNTGQPYWPVNEPGRDANRHPAEIFATQSSLQFTHKSLGLPRYTLTVFGTKLLARIGEPSTGWVGRRPDSVGVEQPTIICLDLAAQGRLLWQRRVEEGWTYDGTPIGQGDRVFVAMREEGARPQSHVACLDADDGRLLWRQFVCAAESRTQPGEVEYTHNLLTLDDGMLFFNSNLGAIAALSAREGRVHWVTTYPRTEYINLNEPSGFYYRDVNPCVVSGETVYVAPAETPSVLALDRATGRIRWSFDAPDTTHVLAATRDRLILGGKSLGILEIDSASPNTPGKLLAQHFLPEGPEGFGRGALAGNTIFWPTRGGIHIFNLDTTERIGRVDLAQDPAFRTTAGNLLVGGEQIIIAQHDRLIALSQFSPSLRSELERIAAKTPSDPRGWYDLARCEREMGLAAEAAASFKRCRNAMSDNGWPLGPTRTEVEAERFSSLLQAADDRLAAGEPRAGRDLIEQARPLATQPIDRLQIAKAQAKLAARANDEGLIAKAWKTVLTDNALESLSIEDEFGRPMPAWTLAVEAVDRLAEPQRSELLAEAPWPMHTADPAEPQRVAFRPTLWQVMAPIRLPGSAERLSLFDADPAVHPTLAVFWDQDHIIGLHPSSADTRWTHPIETRPIWQALVGSTAVFVLTTEVQGLDPTTGDVRWRLAVADEPGTSLGPLAGWQSPPKRRVVPFRQSDGATLDWSTCQVSEALVFGTTLVLRQGTTQVMAIETRTGQPLWVHRPRSGQLGVAWATPTAGVVVQHLPSMQTIVLDPTSGQQLASHTVRQAWSASDPQSAGSDGIVFRAPPDRWSYLNVLTGEVLWIVPGERTGKDATPAQPLNGAVLVSRPGGGLMPLEPESGSPLWTQTLRPSARLLVMDDALISLASGIVRGQRLSTGEPLWPQDRVVGSPSDAMQLANLHGLIAAYPERVAAGEPITISLLSVDGQFVQTLRLQDQPRSEEPDVASARIELVASVAQPYVWSSAGTLWRLEPMP